MYACVYVYIHLYLLNYVFIYLFTYIHIYLYMTGLTPLPPSRYSGHACACCRHRSPPSAGRAAAVHARGLRHARRARVSNPNIRVKP